MQSAERRYGRRGFLLLLGGGLSSLAWAGPVSRLLAPLTSAGSQLVGNLLPVGGWRIYTISGTMPLFDPSSWRLEIGGLVKRPRSLSYEELTALPKVDQISSFHCVTGWTVTNVHWAGVRFQHLFDLVEPLPTATAASGASSIPLRATNGSRLFGSSVWDTCVGQIGWPWGKNSTNSST